MHVDLIHSTTDEDGWSFVVFCCDLVHGDFTQNHQDCYTGNNAITLMAEKQYLHRGKNINGIQNYELMICPKQNNIRRSGVNTLEYIYTE